MPATATADESKRIRRNYLSSFSDFPDGLLTSVTDYLHPISRVLLAVSLSAPSESLSWNYMSIRHHLSGTSKNIISNGAWDILDLESLDESLAIGINDDVIRSILVVIDAPRKLKKLKLRNYSNIRILGIEC